MREILFRGKRDKKYDRDQDWVYGVPYIDNEGDCIMADDCSRRVVIPETVGQYTGLTDKNGTKIFEGDIVKWNINFAIVWQDCKFVIKKDINAKPYDYVLSCFDGKEFEIIGNIHDNPELIEEGGKQC